MSTEPQPLHHNVISLPTGKTAADVVGERHDIVLLFDATKANPNGDPDTGNMPRLQPDTLRGLVTDVCLKRKIRNFFSLYHPSGEPRGETPAEHGYAIFIRENAILKETLESDTVKNEAKSLFKAWLAQQENQELKNQADELLDGDQFEPRQKTGLSEAKKKQAKELLKKLKEPVDHAYKDALCSIFADNRFFGAVASTDGPLKGSFYGQIRGPLQFAFAESLHRVLQLDATITRCAVASEKEKKETESGESEDTGNRTMGRKHLVNYGLYRTHIYFSPAFGAKTRFTYYDLDNFFFALMHMFRDDTAAGRAGMRVVGLVDFQHMSALGNEHSHKLFDMVCVKRTEESLKRDFPESLTDYWGLAPEGTVRDAGESNGKTPLVTAKKLVWEIPACPKAQQLQ
jgi:CRISPR-associated protein Csd2